MTVLAHARAILAKSGTQHVRVAKGDIRAPKQIFNDPNLGALIDFSRPVAVLFIAVLHFVTDEEDPYRIVTTFRDATTPGSYLAITIAITDGVDPHQRTTVKKHYENATAPSVFRTRQQILQLFDGYELVDPGFVRIPDWRPLDETTRTSESVGASWFYAGVGRKS